MEGKFYTQAEAAARLGIKMGWLQRLIGGGKIRTVTKTLFEPHIHIAQVITVEELELYETDPDRHDLGQEE